MLGKYGIGFGKITKLLLTQSTMGLQPAAHRLYFAADSHIFKLCICYKIFRNSSDS